MSDAQSQPMLPCVDPNPARVAVLGDASFSYIGRGLAQDEFAAYVAGYDFGTIPPDAVVIHHTVNPDASWAPRSKSSETWWDRDEAGLTETAIRNKRNKQLDGIAAYYRSLGWKSGPHLFIDDRYIWLFTPMYEVGTHAAEGNSYTDSAGRLHYSIGIEVIGYYEKTAWPPAVAANVRHAVKTFQARLRTFELVYRAGPLHRPDLHKGAISRHADYNKPGCPGAAISGEYIISVLTAKSSPIDPLRTNTLAGPAGAFFCSKQVFTFYSTRGGFALFGYALADEQRDGDATWTRCERAVIKTSATYGVELALLSEARARGWA